jgi:hypothetical protein
MDSRELAIPPHALEDPDSRELVRAWVANNALHCSLDVFNWGDDEAIGWGVLISDIARHVADALKEQNGTDTATTIAKIREVFNDELDSPTAETNGHLM